MYDVRCAPDDDDDDDDDTHPLFFPAQIPHISRTYSPRNQLESPRIINSYSPRNQLESPRRVPRVLRARVVYLLWLTTRDSARVTTRVYFGF